MSNYDEDDTERCDQDHYPSMWCPDLKSTPVKALDILGALTWTAGNVARCVADGLQMVAMQLSNAAWHDRFQTEELRQLAYDRAEFDNIISQPVLLDEPGEE